MAEECSGTRPISRGEKIRNVDAASEGVRNGSSTRRSWGRRNAGAPKGPTKKLRELRRLNRTMRRGRRGKKKVMVDVQIATTSKEGFHRSDGAERDVAGRRRRKTQNDDRRTLMTLTIRLAQARRMREEKNVPRNPQKRER